MMSWKPHKGNNLEGLNSECLERSHDLDNIIVVALHLMNKNKKIKTRK